MKFNVAPVFGSILRVGRRHRQDFISVYWRGGRFRSENIDTAFATSSDDLRLRLSAARLDSFLRGSNRREHIPAPSAEEYAIAAIGIEHLLQRGATDDLFALSAVSRIGPTGRTLR